MVNKKKYKFRGLVLMFKKGNRLSISINSNVNLSATQLHPIHHPAGSLSHLWRLKLNHTAPLGLPILHLDVSIQHVAWAQGGKKRSSGKPELSPIWAPLRPNHLWILTELTGRVAPVPGAWMPRTQWLGPSYNSSQPNCHSSANRTTIWQAPW